jgi:hypothetical protein
MRRGPLRQEWYIGVKAEDRYRLFERSRRSLAVSVLDIESIVGWHEHHDELAPRSGNGKRAQ